MHREGRFLCRVVTCPASSSFAVDPVVRTVHVQPILLHYSPNGQSQSHVPPANATASQREADSLGSCEKRNERVDMEVSKENALALARDLDALSCDRVRDVLEESERAQERLMKALWKRASRGKEVAYPADDPAERCRYVGGLNKGGKPHGIGALFWKNGSRYEGQFQNDALTGYGVYYWPQAMGNKRYCGEWLQGKAEGFGTLTSYAQEGDERADAKNGGRPIVLMRYSGLWKEGLMDGVGKLEFESGDVYEGLWKLNCKHGYGVYRWRNGDVYRGEFDCNQMHGRGTMFWPNGSTLRLTMITHVSEECWALSVSLWFLFFLVCLYSVLEILLLRSFAEQHKLDNTFTPPAKYSVAYFGQFALVFFYFPLTLVEHAIHVVSNIIMLLLGLGEFVTDQEVVGITENVERLGADSDSGPYGHGRAMGLGAQIGGVGAMLSLLVGPTVTKVLRDLIWSELALPELRLFLVFLLRSSIHEMFASIIFSVSCWLVRMNKNKNGRSQLFRVSDRTCWRLGLFLGSFLVVVSSWMHSFFHLDLLRDSSALGATSEVL